MLVSHCNVLFSVSIHSVQLYILSPLALDTTIIIINKQRKQVSIHLILAVYMYVQSLQYTLLSTAKAYVSAGLDSTSTSSDLHCSVLEGVLMSLEWLPVNSISIAGCLSTEVQSIEVACMAGSIPPCPFKLRSTISTIGVTVSVKSREGLTIPSHQGITSCTSVATNVEGIFGPSIADREETIVGKFLHTCEISKAYFELGAFCSCSEAVNVLEAQPVFTVRVTEAIDIAGPVAVEVNRAIHSPLDDLPLSVHITEQLEWPVMP